MANGRTAKTRSLDVTVAAADATPLRSVLPLPPCAERRPARPGRDRLRLNGAAVLSAVLHGGLLALLLLALSGGKARTPGEESVMLVSLASAGELGGGQNPPPAQSAQDDQPQSEALQAAHELPPADDAFPLRFENPPRAKPRPPEKPKQTAQKQPIKPAAPIATPVSASSDSADAGTPDRPPGGPVGAPGNSAGGKQIASLSAGPVGAFNGMALSARFRTPPTAPPYPKRALAQNQYGVVTVRALVDERGHAQDIRVYGSSGYPLLDRAALEAVARWDFLPAVHDGKPVAAWVEVPVRFNID
jgi:protein TonB